jgi:hypothetical protein
VELPGKEFHEGNELYKISFFVYISFPLSNFCTFSLFLIMSARFCAVCASRRRRNLIDAGKFNICIRCYFLYFILDKASLPRINLERSYLEAKNSDWTPSYRYGGTLGFASEKIIVQHMRECMKRNRRGILKKKRRGFGGLQAP